MTLDGMVKLSERANKVKDSIGEWELTDQVKFLSALANIWKKSSQLLTNTILINRKNLYSRGWMNHDD